MAAIQVTGEVQFDSVALRRVFAVNVLHDDQQVVAVRLAGRR